MFDHVWEDVSLIAFAIGAASVIGWMLGSAF